MNLLYIGKFPPLEGGTSAAAYWRLLELSRAGHLITVITACPKDKCIYAHDSGAELSGIRVIVIDDIPPWHIPFSGLYAERLCAAALDATDNSTFDMVEGCYLAPFGVAAWMVAKELGLPLVLRHAGSDFRKLFAQCGLTGLWRAMFRDVYRLVTYPDCYGDWSATNMVRQEKIALTSRYVPAPAFAERGVSSRKDKHLAFMGKITAKWQARGFDRLIDFLSAHKEVRVVTCYAGGDGLEEFRRFWSTACSWVNLDIRPFVPPDQMPAILKTYKMIFCGGDSQAMREAPNTLLEAAVSGCSVLVGADELPVATPYWAAQHSYCLRRGKDGAIVRTTTERESALPYSAYKLDYDKYVSENFTVYGIKAQGLSL